MPDFSFVITAEELTKGLRPSKRVARDMKFLVESKGAVGRDGVLSSIDELTRIATTSITDGFPFPQLFVFTNLIIVCGAKTVYEWVSGALLLKYTAPVAAGTWSAVDFYDYVYLTNGNVAVVRNAESKVFSLSSLPHATAVCNYNGQVLVGAPDVDGLGASLMLPLDILGITTTQLGTVSVT